MTSLRVLFVDGADGEMPTTLAITDEHMCDEHNGLPPYYLDQREAEERAGAGGLIREATVLVPQAAILALFEGAEDVAGHLNPPPAGHASMRLRVFFVAYEDIATTMPNALVVCDEYIEDAHGTEHPDFYLEACAKALAAGGDGARGAHAFVYVDERDVRALFEVPVLRSLMDRAPSPQRAPVPA